MNKFKTVCTVFLLLIITAGVVFVPQIVGKINEKALLNEVVNRSYSIGSRPKLTSEQVAKLYYNKEINIDYNLSTEISDEDEYIAIKNDVDSVIENLFGNNAVILNSVKTILTSENYSCTRKSVLTKVEGKPIALNFINFGLKADDRYFEILYEEKTKAVISLTCDAYDIKYSGVKDLEATKSLIENMLSNYYENILHVSKNEYIFGVVDHRVYVTENGGIANFYMGSSLLQKDDKLIYIEQSYN